MSPLCPQGPAGLRTLTHGGCLEPLKFSQLCSPALVTGVFRWASELLMSC